jgi:hypothetical protein
MPDILDKLVDLHRQATTERSHYYVAATASEAVAVIMQLRASCRPPEQPEEMTTVTRAMLESDIIARDVKLAAVYREAHEDAAEIADLRRQLAEAHSARLAADASRIAAEKEAGDLRIRIERVNGELLNTMARATADRDQRDAALAEVERWKRAALCQCSLCIEDRRMKESHKLPAPGAQP